MPPTQIPNQYRAQRWIVRRGPLVAAFVITAGVTVKMILLIASLIGWQFARTDFWVALETVDHIPWPVAILMLFAAWMIVFLGVPLWQKYLACEERWTHDGEDDPRGKSSAAQPSKGARTGRID